MKRFFDALAIVRRSSDNIYRMEIAGPKYTWLLLVLLLQSAHGATPRKPSWRDHPVYRENPDSVKPPILVWYTTRMHSDTPSEVSSQGYYIRQGYKGVLLNDTYFEKRAGNRLMNYDILVLTSTQGKPVRRLLTFETTRTAQMCLVLSVLENSEFKGRNSKMNVPGFTSLGRARWSSRHRMPRINPLFSFSGKPVDYAYIACKTIEAGKHVLPSADLIRAQYRAHRYDVIFSEANGDIPKLTEMPPDWEGPKIVQNRRCPPELHDMWVVESHDREDPDISERHWKTWHPQKDYLYGCYYGHEHGTPGSLAGYTERFHYTAWKNHRQAESHTGFKSYVFALGQNFVFLNIHADTKSLARVNRQHHSMVIAVTDRISGNLLYEMSCKANFGASFASLKEPLPHTHGWRTLPIGDARNRALLNSILFNKSNNGKPRPKKRINVFNVQNLDPRLKYKRDVRGNLLGRGLYEMWVGGIDRGSYCMTAKENTDGVQLEIKNAETACKHDKCTERVILGRFPTTTTPFKPNLGSDRSLSFRGVKIHPTLCPFDLPEPNSQGYMKFYTDPYCHSLCDGPGPNCIMQQIHRSFKGIYLQNIYEVSDVHGHYTYKPIYSHPWKYNSDITAPRKTGLRGICQIEGALSI